VKRGRATPQPRPAPRYLGDDLLNEAPRLGHHGLVTPRDRANDELLDAVLDVLGDPLDDVGRLTHGEVAGRISLGALLIGLADPVENGVALATEIERETRTVVILVDRPPMSGGRRLDGFDHNAGLLGCLWPRLPARADTRGALNGCFRVAADPHRDVRLQRARRDRGALELVVAAVEIDAFLAPQAPDDLEPLVGLAAAALGVDAERLPFGRGRAANAERRQEPPLRQHVDGGALLGDEYWIAERQRNDVHAELESLGAPGNRGDGCHAFEDRFAADDAIRLPEAVDAALLAQIDPAPVAGGRVERKLHEANADGNGHLQSSDRDSGPHRGRHRRHNMPVTYGCYWLPND